ncbi:hypothetical protein GYB22_05215 [bacterium]|nr:hypothetical protein [bacterium]
MLTKNEVLKLSDHHSSFCVSIFIPTHRSGAETMEGKDAINLKNQLKSIRTKLSDQGMSDDEIESFTKPISELIEDSTFWRYQSDGLAIFLSEELFQMHTVPVHFEAYNYLSNEFYLKPLIPLFNGDGLFYLLTLQKDDVKFFEGSRHQITEINIDDLIPGQLEDRVGYDYEDKGVQFRTQQGNQGVGTFHGQEDTESTEKKELERYFRAIDNGILNLLHDKQQTPLIIASLDYYYPIYKEISSYGNVFSKHISGNPADKDSLMLHEEAWNLVQPYFDEKRTKKLKQFSELIGTGKASANLNDILPAAFAGRIDTLFLENKADVFGVYDPKNQELRVDEKHEAPNVSLLNLLAMKVLNTGGDVYLLEKKYMPIDSAKANALYRY